MSEKVVPIRPKYPKRVINTAKTIKKIIESLPATFTVLKRRTNLARGTLSKYLKELTDPNLEIIVKTKDPNTNCDVYYLSEAYMKAKNSAYSAWLIYWLRLLDKSGEKKIWKAKKTWDIILSE